MIKRNSDVGNSTNFCLDASRSLSSVCSSARFMTAGENRRRSCIRWKQARIIIRLLGGSLKCRVQRAGFVISRQHSAGLDKRRHVLLTSGPLSTDRLRLPTCPTTNYSTPYVLVAQFSIPL